MVIYEHKRTRLVYAAISLDIYVIQDGVARYFKTANDFEHMIHLFPFEFYRKRKARKEERQAVRENLRGM